MADWASHGYRRMDGEGSAAYFSAALAWNVPRLKSIPRQYLSSMRSISIPKIPLEASMTKTLAVIVVVICAMLTTSLAFRVQAQLNIINGNRQF